MQESLNDRLGETLVALPVELASRRRHDAPVEFHYVHGKLAPGLPGGTVCVVSGEHDAPLLQAVREAARKEDAVAVAKALRAEEARIDHAVREFGHRPHKQPTVNEALASLPAITEVSYRGRPVAQGMVAHPELRAMRVLVPYAGGRLDPHGFVASTYVHGKHAPGIESVVIVREPELTPIERKVLERLPEEVNQLTIGDPGIVANWGLLAAGLVLVGGWYVGVKLAEYAKEQLAKKEAEHRREMEREIENLQEVHQEAQQEGQQEAQQEGQQQQQGQQQGEGQAQQQEQHAEGQGERQAEGQQQGEGQGEAQQEHNANSGSLRHYIDEVELTASLQDLTANAAVATLVQLRTSLMMQGRLR